jgi:hypothetical protein
MLNGDYGAINEFKKSYENKFNYYFFFEICDVVEMVIIHKMI